MLSHQNQISLYACLFYFLICQLFLSCRSYIDHSLLFYIFLIKKPGPFHHPYRQGSPKLRLSLYFSFCPLYAIWKKIFYFFFQRLFYSCFPEQNPDHFVDRSSIFLFYSRDLTNRFSADISLSNSVHLLCRTNRPQSSPVLLSTVRSPSFCGSLCIFVDLCSFFTTLISLCSHRSDRSEKFLSFS